MRTKTLLAGAAIAAAASMAAASASAQIVNGSFETGDLTGWDATNFSVVTDTNGYFPTDGQFLASGFAGCGTGVYCTMSQTFTTAGGVFSGDAAFLAHDYMPYDDDAFVSIASVADGAPTTTLFSSAVDQVGNFGSTPWTHFTTNLDAGSYTVTVGVRNNLDNNYSSQVVVDNFQVSGGVPEPAAWALMLTGFFGAGAVLRNRRKLAVA